MGAFVKKFPNLQKVDFDDNKGLFTSDGLSKLCEGLGAEGHAGITELSLWSSDIQADAGEAIGAFLRKLPKLQKIEPDNLQKQFLQDG